MIIKNRIISNFKNSNKKMLILCDIRVCRTVDCRYKICSNIQ